MGPFGGIFSVAGRCTIGSVALMNVKMARTKSLELRLKLQAHKNRTGTLAAQVPSLKEFVAGEWEQGCYDSYRQSTGKSTRSALRSQLLPAFGYLPLDRIARPGVNRWFDAYSQTSPGGANSTLDLLQQIINHAIAHGHVWTNPARGFKRNPRPRMTRFLSRVYGVNHFVLYRQPSWPVFAAVNGQECPGVPFSFLSFCFDFVLSARRFALVLSGSASVALDVHLKDARMVYQPVNRGDGHGLVWEDPVPCTEGLVGSDREATIFVSSCDQLEEDGAFGTIFLGICDVVQNDEIEFVEFCECGFQDEILSRGLKSLHEVGGYGSCRRRNFRWR